ncbi:potassium-transporting ATPase subunit C, partial [Salmonella enterica]|uniref:potassium-transporting ATPase subunit C n=1 Tax=Salmonella enterica TaxID=28901 RepID=UPI00398C6DDB
RPQARSAVRGGCSTSWASGLANQASAGGAACRIPVVAAARRRPVEQVAQLVAEYTHRPLARFLWQPVVKIVERKLALDALQGHRSK